MKRKNLKEFIHIIYFSIVVKPGKGFRHISYIHTINTYVDKEEEQIEATSFNDTPRTSRKNRSKSVFCSQTETKLDKSKNHG